MSKKKTISIALCVALVASALFVLVGCADTSPFTPKTDYDVTSNSLYVKKVSDLPDDFVMGMDASQVLALEASGVKYYDYDGTETDVFKILADNGINTIRVRVWNDPFDAEGHGYGGGNCTIDTALEIGKRANKYGMNLMVDFHYSDFWADPNKQQAPKDWAGMKLSEKTEALKKFTASSLNKLKRAGVRVNIVQVGNETNGKMCGENDWMSIAKLMNAGSEAIRKVYPNALVAVHFANPEKVTNYRDYASKLDNFNVDYDVFASSYYPYWHGTLDNLSTLLSEIATKYNKKVMVAETSYAFTSEDTDFSGNTIGEGGAFTKNYPFTVQGQSNSVRDVINAIANTKNGIGVCYWEGTWIGVGGSTWEENSAMWEKYGSGWASSYAVQYDPNDAGKYYGGCAVDNQAFFDKDGKVTESLKVFALARTGNVIEVKPDALEDVAVLCVLGKKLTLPTKVNSVMNDDSKQLVDVTWDAYDEDAMQSGGVKKYVIKGTASGMEVVCNVSMIEANYLANYSFEDDDEGTGWLINAKKTCNELYVENKQTDSMTGTKHYHFWAGSANAVDFELEQEVANMPAGKFKFAISIMGGDGGDMDIYAYVKINGTVVYREALTMTVYNEWHTANIENIEYDGQGTFAVGIAVKCSGSNAWGKIDDALLNDME